MTPSLHNAPTDQPIDHRPLPVIRLTPVTEKGVTHVVLSTAGWHIHDDEDIEYVANNIRKVLANARAGSKP